MKKILILFISTVLLLGCTDNFVELNTDTKRPAEVPAGTLFANSALSLVNFMTSTSVNVNNFRLWSQQWAQTTYPDESNYILRERNVNGNTWDRLYTRVVKDAREAKTIIKADGNLLEEDKAASSAIVDVIEIFAFSVLVDIFGDIPYSQALQGLEDLTPAYDDDAAIYADLANRLDGAISALSGETSLADYDLVYGGSTTHWKKFANSLKLRMGIRLADSNAGAAQAMVESAVASGVFESSDDDFELTYEAATPNTNPLWVSLVESGRSDFVCANTIADYMNGLEDPRRQLYFSEPYDSIGGIIGGEYGASNSPTPFSKAGTNQVNPEFPGTIMDYTEVCFLLADANERGFNVGGSAEEWYNLGIASSIIEWGGTQEQVDSYMAREDVAYSTATGDWKQKIAMQKWLGLYNRGFEAWNTYRIYNAPVMNVATGAGTTPPMRYTYPVSEFSLNGASVEAAASAIGGDDLFTKVFWDVN